MSKYTKKTLDKLLKKDLALLVSSQQTEMNATHNGIMNQIGTFNEN